MRTLTPLALGCKHGGRGWAIVGLGGTVTMANAGTVLVSWRWTLDLWLMAVADLLSVMLGYVGVILVCGTVPVAVGSVPHGGLHHLGGEMPGKRTL
jgi:hypothetical protein